MPQQSYKTFPVRVEQRGVRELLDLIWSQSEFMPSASIRPVLVFIFINIQISPLSHRRVQCREDKGRRCCLGDSIDLIHCHASYFAPG